MGFFRVCRKNSSGDWQEVFKSEATEGKTEADWKPLTLTSGRLCGNNFECEMRIEVFHRDKRSADDLIVRHCDEQLCRSIAPALFNQCSCAEFESHTLCYHTGAPTPTLVCIELLVMRFLSCSYVLREDDYV